MQPSILLTGSTGFIGSNLLIHLKKKNIKIYDLLRSYKKKKLENQKITILFFLKIIQN